MKLITTALTLQTKIATKSSTFLKRSKEITSIYNIKTQIYHHKTEKTKFLDIKMVECEKYHTTNQLQCKRGKD